MTITLTPAQHAGLRAEAAKFGVSPEQLIQRFVSDLTDTAGTGGSDERSLAQQWALRSVTFGHRRTTDRAERRLWRLQSEAARLQRQEQDEHRSAMAVRRAAGGAR